MKYWTIRYVQKLSRKLCYIFVICCAVLILPLSFLLLPKLKQLSEIDYESISGISFPKLDRTEIAITPVAAAAPVVSDAQLYPQVLKHLVKVNNLMTGTSGSGVLVWSGKDKKNKGHTFILTNQHVLPVGQPGTVEIYKYMNFRDIESIQVYPAMTVISNGNADLSLVEVYSNEVIPNIASLISSDDYELMQLYNDVLMVGCGLGNPPFVSTGQIILFEKERLTINGFSVWGCSGGGVFDKRGKLVSITCKIGMASVAGKEYAVTNISISVPINIICDWLLQTPYKFVVNGKLGSINDLLRTIKYY